MAVNPAGHALKFGFEVPFYAGSDVTAHRFVQLDATKNRTILPCPGTVAKGVKTIGVALESTNPDVRGQTRTIGTDIGDYKPQVTVQMGGIAMVEAGAAITAGADIQIGADGKAVASGAGQLAGIAMTAAASGELVGVWLNQMSIITPKPLA